MKKLQLILDSILSKNIFEYILIDRNMDIISFSEGVENYGERIRVGEELCHHFPEFIGYEDEIQNILDKKRKIYTLETICKNGSYLNLSIEYYSFDRVMILLHNITDITLSKQKLLQSSNESVLLNNTLEKILDKQNALLFLCYQETIVYANQKLIDYFGIEDMEDFLTNLRIYHYFDKGLKSYSGLFSALQGEEKYINIKEDTFILKGTFIESTHILFTLSKVTQLSKEMHIDALTGLYRKSYFTQELEKLLETNERYALSILDLDNFKRINDTYGHVVGDTVLQEFSNLVKTNIRKEDIFARWGGEEFLLLLKYTNIENAIKKVENIRRLIAEHHFEHIGQLTVSFGITYNPEDKSVDMILSRADEALYEAKRSGKNRVVFK